MDCESSKQGSQTFYTFYSKVFKDTHLMIYDCSPSVLRRYFYYGAIIAFYCVDLSEPLNEKRIYQDLEEFINIKNQRSHLILVGTKFDLGNQDKINKLLLSLQKLNFEIYIRFGEK